MEKSKDLVTKVSKPPASTQSHTYKTTQYTKGGVTKTITEEKTTTTTMKKNLVGSSQFKPVEKKDEKNNGFKGSTVTTKTYTVKTNFKDTSNKAPVSETYSKISKTEKVSSTPNKNLKTTNKSKIIPIKNQNGPVQYTYYKQPWNMTQPNTKIEIEPNLKKSKSPSARRLKTYCRIIESKSNPKLIQKEPEGKLQISRKQMERGGQYKNIQETHIVYSRYPAKFNMIEKIQEYQDKKRLDLEKLRASGSLRSPSAGKSTYTFMCDMSPKKKKEKLIKSEIFLHCGGEGMKKIDTSGIAQKRIKMIKTVKDDKKILQDLKGINATNVRSVRTVKERVRNGKFEKK